MDTRRSPDPTPTVPAGMRRFVIEVACFVGLTLALPATGELALGLLDVRTEHPVFERADGSDATSSVRLAWHPQFAQPQPPEPTRDFPAEKAPGTFRIFVVGESPAAGSPYGPAFAFPAWLARRLEAEAPAVRWEVVNAALAGLQSWSALAIVRDVARYQPDLLVVYLGHNEIGTRFTPNERRWIDPRGFGWRSRLVESRVYGLVSRVLPARAANQLIDLRHVHRMGDVSARDAGRRVLATRADRSLSAALYRHRLEQMVRAMHAAGASTMLLTLTQNLSEWAPAVSSHRAGLRPDEKASWRAAVRAGDALAPHDCGAALDAWAPALALDDGVADLQFKVAACERMLGRLESAAARFRRASDLDLHSQGAPTSFNDILRDVARREDAIMVDVDLAFRRASGPRLIGGDLFIEALHLNLRGQQLVAATVADAIRESRVAGAEVRWIPDAYADPDPEAVFAANPEFKMRERIAFGYACQAAGRRECQSP